MRHAALLAILTACATNPPDPGDNMMPDDPSVSDLVVTDRAPTELGLQWSGTAQHYWLVFAPGDAPAACAPGPALIDVRGTTARVSGLAPHAGYGFRVCAISEGATGTIVSPGVTADGSTLELAPSDPSMLAIAENHETGTLHVTWNMAPNAKSYLVAYREGSEAPATCADGTTTTTTQNAIDLGPLATNRRWAVRVCGVNTNPTPDKSTGSTATTFLHSPLAVNPTNVHTAVLDAQWLDIAWTSTATSFRVAYDTQPVVAGCPGGVATNHPSVVLGTLLEKKQYFVRVCPLNGDSDPLISDGTQFVVTTKEQPVIRVTGLGCTDMGQPTFWGIGDATRWYYTRSSILNTSSAPLCTTDLTTYTSNVQAYASGTYDTNHWSGNIAPQANEDYWVRICYLRSDNTFDQGQQINITAPKIIGNYYYSGTCTPAAHQQDPYVSMDQPSGYTTQGADRVVSLQGRCRVGTTVHLDGDVVHTETACVDSETFPGQGNYLVIATIAASGDGPMRFVATDWWDASTESSPAVMSISL